MSSTVKDWLIWLCILCHWLWKTDRCDCEFFVVNCFEKEMCLWICCHWTLWEKRLHCLVGLLICWLSARGNSLAEWHAVMFSSLCRPLVCTLPVSSISIFKKIKCPVKKYFCIPNHPEFFHTLMYTIIYIFCLLQSKAFVSNWFSCLILWEILEAC